IINQFLMEQTKPAASDGLARVTRDFVRKSYNEHTNRIDLDYSICKEMANQSWFGKYKAIQKCKAAYVGQCLRAIDQTCDNCITIAKLVGTMHENADAVNYVKERCRAEAMALENDLYYVPNITNEP